MSDPNDSEIKIQRTAESFLEETLPMPMELQDCVTLYQQEQRACRNGLGNSKVKSCNLGLDWPITR